MRTKEKQNQTCPECGGAMKYEKHPDVLVYKGCERTVKVLGWWCTECGEGILTGEPLLARAKAFQEFKAEVDQVLGPEAVAAARRALRLSQRRAGALLGGGPRAFQKYESGQQAVSVPMSQLLRLLQNDPSRLEELQATESTRRRS